MIETLLGGLFGGLARLAPEVLKAFDKKNERAHELALQDKALEFEKLRGAQKMAEVQAGADAAWNTGAISALKEAISAQGKLTGVKWVDALSSSVRPVITYAFFFLYASLKVVEVKTTGNVSWNSEDQTIFSSIISFWFLNRIFQKK